MPSDGEADRWTSDGESSSRRDFPLLPDVWSYTLSQHNFSNSSTLKIDHGIRGNLLCLSTAMLQPAVREHAHGTGSPAAPCKRLVIQPATATPSTPWRRLPPGTHGHTRRAPLPLSPRALAAGTRSSRRPPSSRRRARRTYRPERCAQRRGTPPSVSAGCCDAASRAVTCARHGGRARR